MFFYFLLLYIYFSLINLGSYEKAEQKCLKAQYTSELSSDCSVLSQSAEEVRCISEARKIPASSSSQILLMLYQLKDSIDSLISSTEGS